ncbi:hypothetical protein NXZ84_07970 [Mechercharimyces sp. CAU 1602]|nr:hypothetical protein [Mechercharimyces sp. CAU 1602]
MSRLGIHEKRTGPRDRSDEERILSVFVGHKRDLRLSGQVLWSSDNLYTMILDEK